MNDEAAHLVDQVLPQVAYRQWVISFPYKLRFLMAYNQKLTNRILSIFIKTLNSYQKKKAKRYGIKNSKLGSVTFIQRFGSALNLNVHFHSLFTDGVFYKSEGGYEFLQLPAPSKEELFLLATKIHSKVIKLIEKLGIDENESNQSEFDESLLGDISKIAIGQKAGFGERAGKALRRYGIHKIAVDPEGNDPYSANVEGFSLNARVIIAKNNRKKDEWDEYVLLPKDHPEMNITENGPSLEVRFRDRYYVFPKNEVILLPVLNTSVEQFSRLLASDFFEMFKKFGVRRVRVSVEETRGQGATTIAGDNL